MRTRIARHALLAVLMAVTIVAEGAVDPAKPFERKRLRPAFARPRARVLASVAPRHGLLRLPLMGRRRAAMEVEVPRWRLRDEIWKILVFCVPAASVSLADPLMSFIDTVCVGIAGSTIDLASLGPNVVVFNTILWTFCFLSAATTLEVSTYLAENDVGAAQRILTCAVLLAAVIGTTTGLLLLSGTNSVIAATGAHPDVVAKAAVYLRIRALSCPAVLIGMVLQAALLAQRDSMTPLFVIALTSVVNIVGDLGLILGAKMGLAGAAIATSGAQWLAIPLFLFIGYRKTSRVKLRLALPTKKELHRFWSKSAAISVIFISLNTSFLLLCSRATTFSTESAAAHQAMWSMFNLLMCATLPLQQATQVFLPTEMARDTRLREQQHEIMRQRPKDPVPNLGMPLANRLLIVLVVTGMLAGSGLGLIGFTLPHAAPAMFTRDVALWPIMRSFALPTFLSLLLAGAVQVVDGAYLAMNEIGYLVRCSCFNIGLVATYLWLAITVSGHGVQAVWRGLLLLYVVRALEASVWLRGKMASGRKASSGDEPDGGAVDAVAPAN